MMRARQTAIRAAAVSAGGHAAAGGNFPRQRRGADRGRLHPAQQDAWAAEADDLEGFAERLGKHLALIATMDGSPVGFITLDAPTNIGLFYVHPAVAGHGAGRMLYDAIEKISAARGTPQLSSMRATPRAISSRIAASRPSSATPSRSATSG